MPFASAGTCTRMSTLTDGHTYVHIILNNKKILKYLIMWFIMNVLKLVE